MPSKHFPKNWENSSIFSAYHVLISKIVSSPMLYSNMVSCLTTHQLILIFTIYLNENGMPKIAQNQTNGANDDH